MRPELWSLLFALVAAVTALSAQGNKLLVVIEEEAEKAKYSKLWSDLEGMEQQYQHTSRLDNR